MHQRSALEQASDLINSLFAKEALRRGAASQAHGGQTILALVHMTWGSSVHFTDTVTQEVRWMTASEAALMQISRRGPGRYTLRASDSKLFTLDE